MATSVMVVDFETKAITGLSSYEGVRVGAERCARTALDYALLPDVVELLNEAKAAECPPPRRLSLP